MKGLKSMLSFLKSCCLLRKEPHLEKLNKDLDKLESEITSRAAVDGEDLWFIRVERRKHTRCAS